MSKKNKQKFRKRLKAQILQEMSQEQSRALPSNKSKQFTPNFATDNSLEKTQKTVLSEDSQNREIVAEDEALNYTKKDLKKSAIILGSMILIIVALSIIDSKTNIVSKVGTEIFKVLNINS